MKHVIVIETVDSDEGRIPRESQRQLLRTIEIAIELEHNTCFIQSAFNVSSAIDATQEMFGVEPWNGTPEWARKDAE